MDNQVVELAAEVRKSRKYAQIEPGLVSRLVGEELAKGRKPKEVVKNVRSKLHQVGGAYLDASPDYDRWLNELRTAESGEAFKQVCQTVMSRHASTRERLPILEDFYRQIFDLLPPIGSLLDVACGLNPLAIPWMPLWPEMTYYACDMYVDMAGFLNAFFARVHIDGYCQVCDVAAAPPSQPVDLALVLKAIPCLEQIDKQAGTHLLDRLQARYLVISFPAKSLGGRKKGMVENYSARFEELNAGRGWKLLGRLEFETELVFVAES